MYPQRTAREISEQVTNSGTVHIRLLGTDARHWALQKNLLRHHSPYFRALLSPNALDETLNNLEALQATSHLVSAEPFELLVQWLYTGCIDAVPPPTASSPSTAAETAAQLDVYIRLYCLCSPAHLDMPIVQDLALTRMRDLYLIHRASFSDQHVCYIYTHTPPASPLRQIALQAAAHDFMAGNMPSDADTDTDADADADATAKGDKIPPTGGRSFEYMSSSVDFANDLLYLIRTHIGTCILPYPFLASPSSSPPPSPSSSIPPLSPNLIACLPSHPTTPPPSSSHPTPPPPPPSSSHPTTPPPPPSFSLPTTPSATTTTPSTTETSSTTTTPSTATTTPSTTTTIATETPSPLAPSTPLRNPISIPITNLLTPEPTPRKNTSSSPSPSSVRERVRVRSEGEWVRRELGGLLGEGGALGKGMELGGVLGEGRDGGLALGGVLGRGVGSGVEEDL